MTFFFLLKQRQISCSSKNIKKIIRKGFLDQFRFSVAIGSVGRR